MAMEKQYHLNFTDAYVDDMYLYAQAFKYNVFFRAKRNENYKVEVLGTLNGFHHEKGWRIHSIYQDQDALFLISPFTYEIAEYNMKTGRFAYYDPGPMHQVKDRVRAVCKVNRDIWIFQNMLEAKCCVFSMKDRSYEFFDLDLRLFKGKPEFNYIAQRAIEKLVFAQQKIWRCAPNSNYIYSINILTKKIELIQLPLDQRFLTMQYDGSDFLLISSHGDCIAQWNPKTGIKNIRTVECENKINRAFQSIIHEKGYYLLIPACSDEIRIVSEQEGGVAPVCQLPLEFQRETDNRGALFCNCFKTQDLALLFPVAGNGLIEIDLRSMETRHYPLSITENHFFQAQMRITPVYYENEFGDLDAYLTYLDQAQHVQVESALQDKNVGARIFQKLQSWD